MRRYAWFGDCDPEDGFCLEKAEGSRESQMWNWAREVLTFKSLHETGYYVQESSGVTVAEKEIIVR